MRHVVIALSLMFAALCFAAGPALEEMPVRAVHGKTPEQAAWPVLRYERPLHMLAITWKGASAGGYQRVARRMRAQLDLRYLGGGDDRYHVNDKWIEPNDKPSQDELVKSGVQVIIETTDAKNGKLPYDVIFCDNPGNILKEPALQANLLQFVRDGGVLVFCGNIYPALDSPLGKEWPARATANYSWMQGGALWSGEAELAGIPVERLAGHTWIPISEVTEGSRALATGESGAMFARKVGQGNILFVPTGLISRKYDMIATISRRYDHDEIWLRAWDQALYMLARGGQAIPAYTEMRPSAKEALPGATYEIPTRLVNRDWRGMLDVAIHVLDPYGKVVYAEVERDVQQLASAPGDSFPLKVMIPISPDWGSGLYPVYVTLADPTGKRQLQQSLQYIPVAGPLQMTLASVKRGYQPGEEARFTVTVSPREPWEGKLCFGVYDFRGRLLGVSEKAVNLDEKTDVTFTYRLADHGVRVDTLWAEVAAVKGGLEYGRTEVKFYKYQPWSMRNEYQWSTWAGIACAPPSFAPMGMRLMAHAGMNALGYPGRSELFYAAERWGWRYYNEGVGMNTFSPVIEYENDAEIEAQLLKEAKPNASATDLTSAAFVLASVGEEAGFKNGWGTRYYWDTAVAPDKACKALQWYLKTKYPTIEQMNTVWKTNYAAWDEAKLTKEFSGGTPKLEADGWAHPKDSPLGAGVTGVSLAPYQDTADFYNWYYDRFITIARRIMHEQINPVPQLMSSAPTIGSANYDARLTGPSAWNESQMFSIMDGPEPGFGLIWGHFDWTSMTDNMFWGFLLTRSGHNNYWVDIPLMFNNDLSHTRSSFAMRKWTTRLAGHERIILDSKPAPTEVGILGANGSSLAQAPGNMVTSAKVALQQAGFNFADADMKRLAPYKIVFAIGRQSISPAEAEQLDAYVKAGGTLVINAHFAAQDSLGAPQQVSPGCGLAERWGLKVTGKTENVPQYFSNESVTFPLDGVDPALTGSRMSSYKVYREQVEHQGWTQLATYDDKIPAVLARRLGKGRLVFLNAVYQSHWYIQWVTPTGADRQGFYKLVETLSSQAGAKRTLRIAGNPEETLHMAVKQFTDPTGDIRYAIVRTNGEVPWTNGALHWLGSQKACYDILGGEVGKPSPLLGKDVTLNLQPGMGKFLAFTAAPVKQVRVKVWPEVIFTGSPVQVKVEILDAAGKPVPGSFPLELRVAGPRGDIAGLSRSVSLMSGGKIVLNTAFNDPAGTWAFTVTDGITGLSGKVALVATAAPGVLLTPEARAAKTTKVSVTAPGYVPWGWPSEVVEPAQLSTTEFIDHLQRLAALYQRDLSGEGWMTKQYLGYYYDYFPGTRHDLLRPLNDVDWGNYAAAIRQAVEGGATLILTGEDVNIDPATGLSTWPHHDGGQLPALVKALAGAQWSLAARDGDTIQATMGTGKVILSRESIDAAGNTNPEAARWQQRWLAQLQAGNGTALPAPDAAKLLRWWTGREAIAATPRTVSWLTGNQREVKLTLDANKHLGEVFTLTLPPTGTVKDVAVTLKASTDTPATIDVGCDDTPDGDLTTEKLTEAVTRYLATHTPARDANGCRLVPVRVTAAGKVEVMVGGVRVTVQ